MPATPVEARWIIKRCSADPTGGSLQKTNRRGTLVVPANRQWMIKRNAADPTGGHSEVRRGTFIVPDEVT